MHQLADVTDHDFQARVLESEQPVLVEFWAPWCAPCRTMLPLLEELDRERDDLRVVKLNTDDHQVIAARYGVISAPTLILFKHGAEADRINGATPKRALLARLEPHLG